MQIIIAKKGRNVSSDTPWEGAKFTSKTAAKRMVPKRSILSNFINVATPGDEIKVTIDNMIWKINLYW